MADCVGRYHRAAADPPRVDWSSLPYLVGYIAACGVADALQEPDPPAEVMAFGTALPLVMDWLRTPPAYLVPG